MTETIPLASVKAHLSELVQRVRAQHDRVVVTKNGRPAAVLVSAEDLESLEETLAVLSDPDLRKQVRSGRRAARRGDVTPLSALRASRKRAG